MKVKAGIRTVSLLSERGEKLSDKDENRLRWGVACLRLMGMVFVGWIALGTVLVGCQSTVNVQGTQAVGKAPAIKVQSLGNGLTVKQLKGQYYNELYRGRVVIVNKKASEQQLQYQFTWYDDAENEIGIESNAWTPVVVYGKSERSVVGIAPSSSAVGFRVSIRDLKATKVFKTNFLGKY